MKTLSLSGSARQNVGRKGANELRRQERVPAVLYGGEKQTHFSLSYNDAKKLIVTADVYVVELEIEGKKN
jgi:large subunit ribosomal protein L25